MSLTTYYRSQTIKQITVAFGDVFDNLYVHKYDTSGVSTQSFRVPITFGPVDKFYQIRKEGEQDKTYDLQLPRLSYTLYVRLIQRTIPSALVFELVPPYPEDA